MAVRPPDRPDTGPPLCKGGTAWRSHARGDCEADCIILLGCLPSAGAQYGCSVTLLAQRGSAICQRRHSAAPLVQRGDSMAQPCKGGLWSQVDPIGFSAALGTGGDPAWGAKKVGEVPCRDSHILFAFLHWAGPARERSMGAAARRYFVLRRNNTLPRPKIPLWGFWSSSPQRRLWLLGGANLGRWEIKCSWAHRGVSP